MGCWKSSISAGGVAVFMSGAALHWTIVQRYQAARNQDSDSMAVRWRELLLLALVCGAAQCTAELLVGIGKADMTGPVADVYPDGEVRGRQRVVFVNMDAAMASQLVTQHVVQRLQTLVRPGGSTGVTMWRSAAPTLTPPRLASCNTCCTAPWAFVRQSFDAMVEGVVAAVQEAHSRLAPGKLLFSQGRVSDASINRSPTAYAANPAAERAQYADDRDTVMSLVRVEDAQGRGLGLLNWFAVHCTSLNNTNRLISGDNKGVAQQLVERWAAAQADPASGPEATSSSSSSGGSSSSSGTSSSSSSGSGSSSSRQGKGGWGQEGGPKTACGPAGFVAAFAQGAVGDISPNTQGPFCIDTGEACDNPTSTCGGRNEMCHGRGPAWPDDAASSLEIGRRQAEAAQKLYLQAEEVLEGAVDSRHIFLDMSHQEVAGGPWWSSGPGVTCPAAMGYSFAAGTTDGPGQFDFTQGDTKGSNPFWRLVGGALSKPSQEQVDCQAPKPILLNTGPAKTPYDWQPAVVEVGLLRLGQLLVACLPGEPTSMAGRRISRALQEAVRPAWGPHVKVVVAGLVNTYSSYITTAEEYAVQRYEGASTLYGRHTLSAYIQVSSRTWGTGQGQEAGAWRPASCTHDT
ncbi:hypothetical protein QJQ45_022019 [Haematococcus lacustris]|nr:hypothetical protein QJQ45_022019 [Haematococcus lacustris]